MRLVVGPGGQGKTRLARFLAGQLSQQGWATLMLAPSAPIDSLAVLSRVSVPTLVVVDYADGRLDQLEALVPYLAAGDARVRLLLLARTAGAWRDDLASRSRQSEAVARAAVLTLMPVESTRSGRREAWEEAAVALGEMLPVVEGYEGERWPDIAKRLPPPPLDGDRYGTILSIQVDALSALLQAGAPMQGDTDDPMQVLLTHESRYWSRTAKANQLTLTVSMQRYVVAAATLWGAKNSREAETVLTAIPWLAEDDRMRASQWVADLYQDQNRYWSRPQPDRLAEYLIGKLSPRTKAPR
jgi:hypothetical protein